MPVLYPDLTQYTSDPGKVSMSLPNNTVSLLGIPDSSLEMSACLVDKYLAEDRGYPELSELLQTPSHDIATVSGLSDVDYPNFTTQQLPLSSLPQMSDIKKVPLPPELVEQFGHMQCNCNMGAFPEISRAWLTIDSDIFVWNYEDGGDLAYFDGLNETILSVALVKPKPRIFQHHIEFLLCLTTPVDIVLLGVSFLKTQDRLGSTSQQYSEMHLLPDPLFSIPTDNTYITSITGADNGRIFMSGKDGCLYELYYQAEDGWFSRKCRKINHSTSSFSFLVPSFLSFSFIEEDPLVQIVIDDSRHILYTRSEKGTIQVYDLGSDGMQMSRVASLSQQTVVYNAMTIARTIDRTNFKPIVHISPLSRTESYNVDLVAVTYSGVRLYFTTNPFYSSNTSRPYMLTLVHIRLPPGFCATAPPQRPNHVHLAHYRKGTLLLAASENEDDDALWCLSSDAFPFQKQLMETQSKLQIDGRAWMLTEVPSKVSTWSYTIGNLPGLLMTEPPAVVTQHVLPSRRFVILTRQGSHLLNLLRPVDQLRQLLANHGPDTDAVKSFFSLHKESQACATALILACSKSSVNKEIAASATRTFFLYGGEPKILFPTTTEKQVGTQTILHPTNLAGAGAFSSPFSEKSYSTIATPGMRGFNPQQVSTPNTSLIQSPLEGTAFQQVISPAGGSTQGLLGPEVQCSGKHDGLYLYFCRILGGLWDARIVSDIPYQTKAGKALLASRYSSEELGWYLEQMKNLLEFLQRNQQQTIPGGADRTGTPQNIHQRMLNFMLPDAASTHVDHVQQQLQAKYQLEAQVQEKNSLTNLLHLVVKTCETLGLWKILVDHQFHLIAASLSQEMQNQLNCMAFREFAIAGKQISNNLILCLINRYLGDNASTDAISNRLRDTCPSLYSHNDAICSKASEVLQLSKTVHNQQERQLMLQNSLQLYKEVATQINLPLVCCQFQEVHYFTGIVDLCLAAASKRDPKGLALHFYNNGEPQEDQHGINAFRERLECYRTITGTMQTLLSVCLEHPQQPSVPTTPGPPPVLDHTRITPIQAEQQMEKVLQMSLKSGDELFHAVLYDWLIDMELTDKLLEIKSPHLENYLKRAMMYQSNNLSLLDLLWKYYEKNRQYMSAAKILAKLAERHGTDVSLNQRMEYLSRSIICAKSADIRTATGAEGEFLHMLEEKIEVARLQQQVLEAIQNLDQRLPNIREAISRLNSQLLDITQLYGDFAEEFELPECKLAIIHCAGHMDQILIETLWREIIDQEMKSAVGSSTQVVMTTLSNKLVHLGHIYLPSERYFPLGYLTKYLEQKSCQLNLDPKWVVSIMLGCGVKLPVLLDAYDKLFKAKDPCWQASRKPLHLLGAIVQLITTFVEATTAVPSQERRSFVVSCLDAIAWYLVDLQTHGATDVTATLLIRDFRSLQAQLDRMC